MLHNPLHKTGRGTGAESTQTPGEGAIDTMAAASEQVIVIMFYRGVFLF